MAKLASHTTKCMHPHLLAIPLRGQGLYEQTCTTVTGACTLATRLLACNRGAHSTWPENVKVDYTSQEICSLWSTWQAHHKVQRYAWI